MGRVKARSDPTTNYVPLDPQVREQQMINLAELEAERRLRDGTASSEIIRFYLQLGTSKAKLEYEIMKQQRELMEAKTEAINAERRSDAMYEQAIAAMREYGGGYVDHDVPQEL